MCAQIVFCVERSGKFFGFDGFTAAGGVDEFAVADVEPTWEYLCAPPVLKKTRSPAFNLSSEILRLAAAISRAVRGRLTLRAFL